MYIIQGQWKLKFDRQNSFESKFHVSDTNNCRTQMMYQENTYHYGNFREDRVQVLEMFYNGDGISMLIVLPNKDKKLTEVQFCSSQLKKNKQITKHPLTFQLHTVKYVLFSHSVPTPLK